MKYILFFLLLILDIFAFIFLFIYEKYLIQILILHLIIFIICWKLYLKFDYKIDEIPFYIILFMPILGILIYVIVFFSVHYFIRDNEIIQDYEQLLYGDYLSQRRKKLNYEREIMTMSILDLFNFIDPEKKKELLIDSQYSYQINNAKILKKGLSANDKEVQHYSATLLNSQENELTNNISNLREEFNESKNEKVLDELINSYKMYLNSTLIENDSINIFRKEYIDVMLKKIERNTYDIDTLNSLFKEYIKTEDLYNATLINDKIKKEFEQSNYDIINKFNIMYNKGYLKQLNFELSKLNESDIEKNKKLKDLKSFFIKEDN